MKRKKEPVKLRSKKLADGNESLYLDIYVSGKRRYEFLKLYLIPEKNKGDRIVNEQTMSIAEAVRSQRIVEIQKGMYDFNPKGDTSFWTFVDEVVALKKAATRHPKQFCSWDTFRVYLHRYSSNQRLKLKDIDEDWAEGFMRFLTLANTRYDRPLSNNTRSLIYSKLKTVLKEAERRGLIDKNPALHVCSSPVKDSERVFLTIDELKRLFNTETKYAAMKRAFLFSCLTGIRASDISTLTWGCVSSFEGLTRLTFRQYKTNGQMYLDINEQASELMGERGDATALVFGDFCRNSATTGKLRNWAKDAGIDKPLTFHSARHTFAVMMLTLGTDIYTVSKLLGHKNLQTTQVYADVVDRTKRDAVTKIPKM